MFDKKIPTRSAAVEKVLDHMWDNFSYQDYMPDILAEEAVERSHEPPIIMEVRTERWKPIVTVPKPFNMTVREEKKQLMKERRKWVLFVSC